MVGVAKPLTIIINTGYAGNAMSACRFRNRRKSIQRTRKRKKEIERVQSKSSNINTRFRLRT